MDSLKNYAEMSQVHPSGSSKLVAKDQSKEQEKQNEKMPQSKPNTAASVPVLPTAELGAYKGRLEYKSGAKDMWARDDGLHNGQKKLFLGEALFLTRYGNLAHVVLYIGAAPGIHLPLLQQMFPHHVFYCYDPATFACAPNERLILLNQFFGDKDASYWAGAGVPVLVISDIRLNAQEEQVAKDMELQRKWVKAIKPQASSLKFRLPWQSGKTQYLKGKAFLQPFAPSRSTETRLFSGPEDLAEKAGEQTWDNKDYESLMFHFNCIARNEWRADEQIQRLILAEYVAACGEDARALNYLQKEVDKFFPMNQKVRRARAQRRRNRRGSAAALPSPSSSSSGATK
jgi:hypothetical protein